MTAIHLTRALPASPERVWRAFTDPAALAAWFWPAETFGTVVEVDLRPGGRFRIDAAAKGFAVSGSYLEVQEPHRLVFSWRWDGEATETLVTVLIRGTAGGSELDLTHDRFADPGTRDSNAQGWADCLDRLPAWLAG